MRRLIVLCLLFSACQSNKATLFLISDSTSGDYGYVNSKHDTIIPVGKYSVCYTDTFKKFAIVLKKNSGIVGINRDENILFKPYIFDNGPDYISEGYFRIIENNKIGYADTNGVIVIKPQFACAFPFEKGVAKVSNDCRVVPDGEHSAWDGNSWFYINKSGKRVK